MPGREPPSESGAMRTVIRPLPDRDLATRGGLRPLMPG